LVTVVSLKRENDAELSSAGMTSKRKPEEPENIKKYKEPSLTWQVFRFKICIAERIRRKA
jgi:hypothetical protein